MITVLYILAAIAGAVGIFSGYVPLHLTRFLARHKQEKTTSNETHDCRTHVSLREACPPPIKKTSIPWQIRARDFCEGWWGWNLKVVNHGNALLWALLVGFLILGVLLLVNIFAESARTHLVQLKVLARSWECKAQIVSSEGYTLHETSTEGSDLPVICPDDKKLPEPQESQYIKKSFRFWYTFKVIRGDADIPVGTTFKQYSTSLNDYKGLSPGSIFESSLTLQLQFPIFPPPR